MREDDKILAARILAAVIFVTIVGIVCGVTAALGGPITDTAVARAGAIPASAQLLDSRDRTWTVIQTGFISSAVADLATTAWALRQPGLREGNPFAAGMTMPQMLVFKAVGTAGMLAASRWLYKRAPVTAKIVLTSQTALWATVSARNARLAATH